jgi:predicted GTPase
MEKSLEKIRTADIVLYFFDATEKRLRNFQSGVQILKKKISNTCLLQIKWIKIDEAHCEIILFC